MAAGTAIVVVAADQLTKWWAESRLSPAGCSVPDGCIELVGSLRLRLVENPGSAFGMGTGAGPLLGVVAGVMTVVLLVASRRAGRGVAAALGLVAGGAAGNLVDRLARAEDGPLSGRVVDFVDLQWWPVFNVADSAIVAGVLVLVLASLVPPPGARDEDHEGEQV